jgi:hypothetical protein
MLSVIRGQINRLREEAAEALTDKVVVVSRGELERTTNCSENRSYVCFRYEGAGLRVDAANPGLDPVKLQPGL